MYKLVQNYENQIIYILKVSKYFRQCSKSQGWIGDYSLFNDMQTLKSGQIWILVPKYAKCSETYTKSIFPFFAFFHSSKFSFNLSFQDLSTKNYVLLGLCSNSDLHMFQNILRKWKKNIRYKKACLLASNQLESCKYNQIQFNLTKIEFPHCVYRLVAQPGFRQGWGKV